MHHDSMVGGSRQSFKRYNNSVAIGVDLLASWNQGAVVPRSHTLADEYGSYSFIANVHNPADVAPSYFAQTEGCIEIWVGGSTVTCKRPPRHSLKVGGADGRGLNDAQQEYVCKSQALLLLQGMPQKIDKQKAKFQAAERRLEAAALLGKGLPAAQKSYINHGEKLRRLERDYETYQQAIIKADRPKGMARKGGGVRGQITDFSRGSRWRLMKLMGKLLTSSIPLFVTLTYPAEFSLDPKDWKRDLSTFFKRLKRRFPHSSALWKLEPQQRGAPHYHMFIWGVDEMQLRIWIAQAWFEVVDSGDIKHYYHGVKVEQVRSWAGVRSYASKYMGKEQAKQPGWEFPGRWWGVFNAPKLPWAKCVRFQVQRKESILFIRTMRRYAKLDKRRKKGRFKGNDDYPSLTILCNNASDWLRQVGAFHRCWPIPVEPRKRGKYARTHETTN